MLRDLTQPSSSPVPLVSICIPAHRADRYLEATLRAVSTQTMTDWELIVVEDGSKDRTESIVRSFAATVRQMVGYQRHEKNQGLPATRNTGIKSARGAWVAFLDADDLWRPEHLERLTMAALGATADLAFSGTDWFEDGTGRILQNSVPTADDLSDLPVALYTGRLSILPSSVIIRRHAFTKYGLISADFPHVNDTEYWLRILKGGGTAAYSGSVTCLYRRHASAMSQQSADLLIDSARLCERYADWSAIPLGLRRTRPADLYRWSAKTLLPKDPRKAVRVAQQAVRLAPFNAKNLGLLAKTVLARGRVSAPAQTS